MLNRILKTNHLDKYFALLFLIVVSLQTILFAISSSEIALYLFFVWYFSIYMVLISLMTVIGKKASNNINELKKNFSAYCLLIIEYAFIALLFSFPERALPSITSSHSDAYFLIIIGAIFMIMVTQVLIWSNVTKATPDTKEKEVALFPKVSKFVKTSDDNVEPPVYYRVAIGLQNSYEDTPIIQIDKAIRKEDGQFKILKKPSPFYYENLVGQSDLDKISEAKDEVKQKFTKLHHENQLNKVENIILK